MKLEIISRVPDNARKAPPLLFVHGSWHTADCWQDYLLPYFVDHGYTVHALSLRGHGRSEGRDKLSWTSMEDYVEDVVQVVNTLPVQPILIGHSMGGDIVRRYLRRYPGRAAVLLTPIPVWGVALMILRLSWRHPLKFMQCFAILDLYPYVGSLPQTRAAFYSRSLDREKLLNYFSRIGSESFRIFLELLWVTPSKFRKIPVPSLVIGAEQDNLFLPFEIRATARAYGSELVMLPDLAHDVMLEDGWQKVAETMLAWMEKLV